MARFDVKMTLVQVFHFSVDAENASQASDIAGRLLAEKYEDPDEQNMTTEIQRGVV